MFHIAIISGSVRTGRKSHNIAKYFNSYITNNNLATAEILDLKEFNFPIMQERLINIVNPSAAAKLFSEKIKKADAVILISPEYNGGYPAAVKNAIDLLVKEWFRKPIGLVGVSSGNFGGLSAIAQLQSILLKIKATPISAIFPVPNVQDAFDDNGNAVNKEAMDKRSAGFLKELIWVAEAFNKMK
jgi:NAD(P)H-dependent FMN reductase